MDDFGARLREARERRGISLRQIAATTKISAAALDALERNDISRLPGGIFSRAFVRSYAIEVGLDPDATVREFLERFDQDAPPTREAAATTIPDEEREFLQQQRKAARVAAAAIGLIVILIAAGVFAYRARAHSAAAALAQAPPPTATSTPAPAVVPAAAAAETPAAAAPGEVTLEIHPTADCWVSVTADGRKLFSRVLAAGQRETVAIARDATIEVGDAGAFAYSINGKPGKPLGDRGQVRTLKFTPATAAEYTR